MNETIKPKVSVMMPVYNTEKYVAEAINSILNQTFTDFELIIIDDGSTDNSMKIIEAFEDRRIRVFKNTKNMGLVYSRNRAIKESRGEYLAILDSDDFSYPSRIEEQINFLEENPDFGMVGSWVEIFDQDGNLTGDTWELSYNPEIIPSVLIFHNCFLQSSIMVRKNYLPEEHYRDGYAPSEDYDLWVRISEKARVWNLPQIISKYRVHQGSISRTKSNLQEQFARKIICNQLNNLNIKPSSLEIEIHRSIALENLSFLFINFSNVEKWLLKIHKKNCETLFYDKKSLEKVISGYWIMYCSQYSPKGLWIARKFMFSKLTYLTNMSFIEKMKITIKLFLER